MTERPILFNGEMVRAILDGRKTQTRRVVKPQPSVHEMSPGPDSGPEDIISYCPYGAPGNQLWVRETWCNADILHLGYNLDDPTTIGYRADESAYLFEGLPLMGSKLNTKDWNWEHESVKWKPSIHMPRWASRINLLIKDVRVERVQDISSHDISAEGISCDREPDCEPYNFCANRIESFIYLWDSINGKRPGCAWADNPWVWVVEFEVDHD